MSSPQTTPAAAASTEADAPAVERIPAHEIDASLRWPLLAIFTSSLGWLLLGTALALIAAIKMHKGTFLADAAWLTVGRVRPASINAILYGFASQAAIGVSFWLLCRLGNVRFAYSVATLIATKVWNIGVAVGVLGILAGGSTGFEWLEMPRYASGLLFAAYAVIGLCALGTFQMRRVRELYPTQWFVFAALFWFPWLYTGANYLLVIEPVRGVFQSVVNAWFTGGFLHLWLGLIALGTLHYFHPKLSGKPLHSGYLAGLAFWTILIFGSWAGMASLLGAPVPRWVPSVGVAASMCLLVPLIANGMNWAKTSCPMELYRANSDARFFVFGLTAYLLAGAGELLLACPRINEVTGLTFAGFGVKALAIHGFIGSVLLGAIYYILPRVLQVRWPSEGSIRVHFFLQVAGALLLFVGLGVGGVLQGMKLANPDLPLLAIARSSVPFIGLSTLGVTLLLLGQLMMAGNMVGIVRGLLEPLARGLCADLCGCGSAAKSGVKP